MKKFLGLTAILYAIVAVASGLSVKQLGGGNADSSAIHPTVTADELKPFYGEDDIRSWNLVTGFSGAYQMDQPTKTPSFYIPGDIFRVTYNIDNECEDNTYAPTGIPFFYIEAMHQTGNGNLLAGRIEIPNDVETIYYFDVYSGNSDFYLYIWSTNCAEWEVTVESLH